MEIFVHRTFNAKAFERSFTTILDNIHLHSKKKKEVTYYRTLQLCGPPSSHWTYLRELVCAVNPGEPDVHNIRTGWIVTHHSRALAATAAAEATRPQPDQTGGGGEGGGGFGGGVAAARERRGRRRGGSGSGTVAVVARRGCGFYPIRWAPPASRV